MIKFALTPERAERIKVSVMIMAVMAKVIQMEYQQDMDVKFKNPQANQFAGRIIKDAISIEQLLKIKKDIGFNITNVEEVEDYAGEIHRMIHFFLRLPVEQIKEVLDNLDRVKEEVEA